MNKRYWRSIRKKIKIFMKGVKQLFSKLKMGILFYLPYLLLPLPSKWNLKLNYRMKKEEFMVCLEKCKNIWKKTDFKTLVRNCVKLSIKNSLNGMKFFLFGATLFWKKISFIWNVFWILYYRNHIQLRKESKEIKEIMIIINNCLSKDKRKKLNKIN